MDPHLTKNIHVPRYTKEGIISVTRYAKNIVNKFPLVSKSYIKESTLFEVTQ